MPWFKNKKTGVTWEITHESAIELAKSNPDMVEVDGSSSPPTLPPTDSNAQETTEEHTNAVGEGDYVLKSMNKDELKELAKSLGIKGYSKMSVDELREAISKAEE